MHLVKRGWTSHELLNEGKVYRQQKKLLTVSRRNRCGIKGTGERVPHRCTKPGRHCASTHNGYPRSYEPGWEWVISARVDKSESEAPKRIGMLSYVLPAGSQDLKSNAKAEKQEKEVHPVKEEMSESTVIQSQKCNIVPWCMVVYHVVCILRFTVA